MITRQEMFNRAVRGLAGQGWEQALTYTPDGQSKGCSYLTEDGKRCAWGHVDPEGTVNADGSSKVVYLDSLNGGIAATLNCADMEFAVAMQNAHDHGARKVAPEVLKESFKNFGIRFRLSWPTGVEE